VIGRVLQVVLEGLLLERFRRAAVGLAAQSTISVSSGALSAEQNAARRIPSRAGGVQR
jgi:hypothetical protein